jgi:hypothetical protein
LGRFDTDENSFLDFARVEDGVEVDINPVLNLDAARGTIHTGRFLGCPQKGTALGVLVTQRVIRVVILRIAGT